MIGNTPHTEPTNKFDVRMLVFDIWDGEKYLGCEERYKIVKKYRLSGVPAFGRFRADDYSGLKEVILALNKGRKEGMVVKSPDRKEAIKYVTTWSDIDDISGASARFFDMPMGFYYQRILRSALFINDFEMDREGYGKILGMAFYNGLEESINKIRNGNVISEEFEILIKDEKVWKDVLKHSSKEVYVEEIYRKQEKGKTRIRFKRVYRKTTKTLTSYMNGKAIED
jgi:putative ATP-dependent DNA ligase